MSRCINVRRARLTTVRVQAVFEKFSERSIKSVMFAQQEAKNLGASEVHGLLLRETTHQQA